MRRLRRIYRIVRWEISQSTTSYNRRTLLIIGVLVLVVGSLATAALAAGVASPSPNTDVYRVGVDSDSPYAAVVDQHNALTARPADPTLLETGQIDILVGDVVQPPPRTVGNETVDPPTVLTVERVDSQKGDAALTAFRTATERYNDQLMVREANESAAFPVIVELQYRTQPTLAPGGAVGVDDPPADADDTADADADADDDATDADDADDTDDTADDSAETAPQPPDREPVDVDTDDSLLGGFFGTTTSGSPAEIQPPFPFASLLLAFLFLIPMNFIIQSYGSSILNERIDRRGELLLVAPVKQTDIVAGKTLPYLAVSVVVTAAIAFGIGGGWVSVMAVVPIALAFLAATFVGAMFARSFKELTFVTVTITVLLTIYVFVPSIFTNVTPIALISPLTLVVMDLQGDPIGFGSYLFSTAPFYFGAGVLFFLGAGVYREEDMFTQKPVSLKFLDALNARLRGPWSVGILTAAFIPFVLIAELLAIAVLFILPVEVSIPLLLVVVAAIEEVAKSIHIYAGFENERFDRSPRMALMLGGISGLAFFIAEKATALSQLVGLDQLPLGEAALQPTGLGPSASLALLAAPLVLHAVTAGIASLGASRNRRWYLLALIVATVVHAGYNLGVVTYLA